MSSRQTKAILVINVPPEVCAKIAKKFGCETCLVVHHRHPKGSESNIDNIRIVFLPWFQLLKSDFDQSTISIPQNIDYHAWSHLFEFYTFNSSRYKKNIGIDWNGIEHDYDDDARLHDFNYFYYAQSELSPLELRIGFNHSILFWEDIFRRHKIELVFAQYAPHWSYSVFPFDLALRQSIPAIFSTHTPIPGFSILVQGGWNGLESTWRSQANETPLSRAKMEAIASELSRITSKSPDDFTPAYEKENNLRAEKQKGSRVRQVPTRNHLSRTWLSDFRKTLLDRLYYTIRKNRKENFVREVFELRAKSSIPDGDFVLFPLHYQPEETSVRGGIYAEQLTIIQEITAHLPKDMFLVVKEHTQQRESKGYRSARWYESVAKIPNVILLHRGVHMTQILDKALGVVTISGSVGMEAYAKGIPVLFYGPMISSNFKLGEDRKNVSDLSGLLTNWKECENARISIDEIAQFLEKVLRKSFSQEVFRKTDHPEMESVIAEIHRLAIKTTSDTGQRRFFDR